MRTTNRKNKRILRKRIIVLVVISCLLVFGASFGGGYYLYQKNKPLYVSPLPQKGYINDSSQIDKDMIAIKLGLKKQKVDYENILESNGNFTINLKDKSVIILTNKKDIKVQLSSLQLILARLTMEGKLFNQLDMRFDKPVIRLK